MTTIISHGIDLVDIARFERTLNDHPDRFLERCFCEGERAYAESRPKRRSQHLAARFAAKEAVMKAIGTGLANGVTWKEIEVRLLPSGAPELSVTGRAAEIALELGITGWLISLSHTDSQAIASVIGVGAAEPTPSP